MNGVKLNTQELCDEEVINVCYYQITVGRLDSNKIVVSDSRLSGLHCKIKWDSTNNIAQLQDLSTNGTFIGD